MALRSRDRKKSSEIKVGFSDVNVRPIRISFFLFLFLILIFSLPSGEWERVGRLKENLGGGGEIQDVFFFLAVRFTHYIQIDLLEEKDAHRSINQSINRRMTEM